MNSLKQILNHAQISPSFNCWENHLLAITGDVYPEIINGIPDPFKVTGIFSCLPSKNEMRSSSMFVLRANMP